MLNNIINVVLYDIVAYYVLYLIILNSTIFNYIMLY
jgi:hypothetical protein